MTPTKLPVGQGLVVFAVILGGLWLATQMAASDLAYQPRLGAPWLTVLSRPLYHPWRLFDWWYHYGAYAPEVFERAGAVAGGSGLAASLSAVAGSLWRARQSRIATTYGSSRWATLREVRRAKLLDPSGCILGRLKRHYLRHHVR